MSSFIETQTDFLEHLNPEQKDAVTTTEGFVRVIAGAGSGKTRAITNRFAYLVSQIGVPAAHILCVTFTNKAALEMRLRIRQQLGDGDTGFICTFHSFCVSVLQEESYAFQYPKSFLVLDNSDIDSMLDLVYQERGLTLRDMTFSNARDMIEIKKIHELPTYYEYLINLSLAELHEKYLEAKATKDIIFYGYLYQQKKCFGLDYNDLIKFVLYIFQIEPEIALKWQKKLQYIMIDEFQDIDPIQYQLMETLCSYNKNLFVVGDPDQTIYTWRGANIRFLLDFDKKFPDTKTIMMNQNYRSTEQIISCANTLISNNKVRMDKKLISLPDKQGPVPIFYHGKTTQDEALWIANYCKSLIDSGVPPKDIAILFRSHFVSRSLEEVFADQNLPFTLYSGIQFFDREEIKDALSYLRMVTYKDDLSFRRIVNKPRRNIGKTRIAILEQHAKENDCSLFESLCSLSEQEGDENNPFSKTQAKAFISLIQQFSQEMEHYSASELLAKIINASDYEKQLRTEGSQDRLDNLAELKQSLYEFENACGEECTVPYYLSHVSLLSGLDVGSKKEAVRFLTVHTAKGLEFPHVIVCGLNETIFPSKKIQSKAEMEEERRLAFVAITRGKQSLAVTDSEGRNLDGSTRFPSRFIFNMGKQNLDYKTELDSSFVQMATSYISGSENFLETATSSSEFAIGDSISHPILGKGIITAIDLVSKTYSIQFEKIGTERSIGFRVSLQKNS
jgi:DNA helicase-2/ATP-dependent DNA helicase PcrA